MKSILIVRKNEIEIVVETTKKTERGLGTRLRWARKQSSDVLVSLSNVEFEKLPFGNRRATQTLVTYDSIKRANVKSLAKKIAARFERSDLATTIVYE